MKTLTSTIASAVTLGANQPDTNLPDITPKFDGPWMPTLNNIASIMLGTFLVVLVIGLGVGLLVWVLGKLSSSGRAQDVGITFIVWTVVAAAGLASASGLIGWAMGLPLF